MASIGLIGAGLVVGVALIYDPSSTIKYATAAIGTVGVTWIVKKITDNISLDASQIIHFTGWCGAGISMIGIVRNAMMGVGQLQEVANKINSVFAFIATMADKITFWN